MKYTKPLIYLLIVVIVIAIVLLFPKPKTPKTDITVVATIFPLQDIAQQVVGNTMEVGLILPAGASPHTFEPSPSTLRNLQSTDVIFSIGHGLDNWSYTIVENTPATIVIVDNGIKLHEYEEHAHEKETYQEDEHRHAGKDPHYYLDLENAIIIATTIQNELSERYPEHADLFAKNTERFIDTLLLEHENIKTQLAPIAGSKLITLHDGWNYFTASYDLEVLGTFEPTPGREPTTHYLIELQTALRDANTKTLYSEPQLSTDSINSFVQDNDLSIAILDPIGGLENRTTYLDLMRYNAKTILENEK